MDCEKVAASEEASGAVFSVSIPPGLENPLRLCYNRSIFPPNPIKLWKTGGSISLREIKEMGERERIL